MTFDYLPAFEEVMKALTAAFKFIFIRRLICWLLGDVNPIILNVKYIDF